MIPKVIHYCWFGGKDLSPLANKCIRSWQEFFPDYEIKRWDESNFDIGIIPYTSQAYKAGKYAFVSDYARFWILYRYGGLYFDTDVEVIRSMDNILSEGAFMGREYSEEHPSCKNTSLGVNPGLGMGAEKGNPVLRKIMDIYETKTFDGSSETIVDIVSDFLKSEGLKEDDIIQSVGGIKIYPKEYFCPIDSITGAKEITPQTVSIHHYAASWQPWHRRLKQKVKKLVGSRFTENFIKLKSIVLHR